MLENTKVVQDDDDDDDAALQKAKQAHSVIERRYRDNLNGKLVQLHHLLSEVSAPGILTRGSIGSSFLAQQPHGKLRKPEILNNAIHYVHQTEVELRHMSDEIDRLKEREGELQKLVKCGECPLVQNLRHVPDQQS